MKDEAGRHQEEQKIDQVRGAYAPLFAAAERTLEAALRFGEGETPTHTSGDLTAPKVLLAIHGKLVYVFWGIIVLAERGLPTASLMRELVEAFIALSWISAEDTPARAALFRDSALLEPKRNLERRLGDEDSKDTITPSALARANALVEKVKEHRPSEEVDGMLKWRTWSGRSVAELVKEAGLGGFIYRGPYAVDSLAVHGSDALEYLAWLEDGVELRAPDRVSRHVGSAGAVILAAMDLLAEHLHIGDRESVKRLFEENLQLSRQKSLKR